MRERAIRFGKATPLIGVLAEGAPVAGPARPGIVFLNSGILHHVGACRLHVRLARMLAEEGFTSLRFDLSGIGDSEARKDSLTFEKSAVLEVQEAMDHLQRSKGIQEFVLIGLCSGADMGFNVAQLDPRVVGLAQFDAYAYRTPGYWYHHYAPKVLDLGRWKSYLGRKLRITAAGAGKGPVPGEDYVRPEYLRKFPPQARVADGLRALVGRGVDLLFLFSGGQPDHYNHRAQYARSFRAIDFRTQLRVEYYADADHLFSGLHHQQAVDAALREWTAKIVRDRAGRDAAPADAPAAAPVLAQAR